MSHTASRSGALTRKRIQYAYNTRGKSFQLHVNRKTVVIQVHVVLFMYLSECSSVNQTLSPVFQGGYQMRGTRMWGPQL